MKNKVLSVLLSALMLATTMGIVIADSDFGVVVTPPNNVPRIYLIKWCADIGTNNGFGQCPISDQGEGSDGTPNPTNLRTGNYLFTGEQIAWKVVVRDPDGAEDISYAKVIADGGVEALCQEYTSWAPSQGAWSNHIPAVGVIPAGYQPDFDKIFRCILTVEPTWDGEKHINIKSWDQSGGITTNAVAQDWFMNPAVTVALTANDQTSSISFGATQGSGNTVMSDNKLVITNDAEGGVDLLAWISMDDLTGSSGAMCPTSNILDVDASSYGISYRGNIGTFFGNWERITNPSGTGCNFFGTCLGAQGIVTPGNPLNNMIGAGGHAEIQFQLEFPVPCIGTFDNPTGIHVIIRAI